MCRLCLVEVEGAPKPQPSCVTTVMEGQVVKTESDQALWAREGVLEFYLVNHPLDCPICDMSGECFLQDYVHAEGRKHGRSGSPSGCSAATTSGATSSSTATAASCARAACAS
jgi:NADH-quinone oxidoreductase subunit G